MRPAPGEKRGAGRERRGAKRAAFWPPEASPPYRCCPQHDRARGAAAAECGRRSQPPPTQNNGMAGACRRARLPPTATRGTAREGTGGGAAEPRRGRAGFCAQPPPPAALAGAAGAVKAQSRRMHGAPLRSRRDGLRAYRRSADAMSGSTTSGNGGQRPHGGREQHVSKGGLICKATILPRVRRSSRKRIPRTFARNRR